MTFYIVEDLTAFEKHMFTAEYDLEGYLYESSETKKQRRILISDHRQDTTDTGQHEVSLSSHCRGKHVIFNFILYYILYCILKLMFY